MSLDPIDEDITDDLTIDGNDLLAELRAAHGRQAHIDPDELTIDGAALLQEIKASGSDVDPPPAEPMPEPPQRPVASAVGEGDPVPAAAMPAGLASQSCDATFARWSPPATVPESDVTVEPRAGKASRVQMLVIAAVFVVALAVGGWAIKDVLQEVPADARDTSENTSESDSTTELNGGQDIGGFGG